MIFLGRFLLAALRQGTFSLAVLVYLVCIWYSRSSSTLASFPVHWFILLCGEIHCEQGYLGTAVPFCGPDFQCILSANLRINLSLEISATWPMWVTSQWLSGMVFQSLRFQPLWMCSQGGVTKWWPFVQKLGVGQGWEAFCALKWLVLEWGIFLRIFVEPLCLLISWSVMEKNHRFLVWRQLYPVDVSMYGISGFGFEMGWTWKQPFPVQATSIPSCRC